MNILSRFFIRGKGNIKKGEFIPYGVRMSGAPLVWKYTMGSGIKVGVIDTGADINHIDLKDRIKKYKDFTGEGIYDYNGHGTHVCGIIAASKNNAGITGVAPECELYIAKTFKKDGTGEEDDIIKAINWMIDENVDVINMSFSADCYTKEYYNVIKKAYNKNIIMVAAAGNEGEAGIGFPAKFGETICVGAVDIRKHKSNFSSVGERIDVSAAGTDILSCYPNNQYAILSGTSMATPIISGAVALIQARAILKLSRKLSQNEIRAYIRAHSKDLGKFGKDNNYGYGLFSF